VRFPLEQQSMHKRPHVSEVGGLEQPIQYAGGACGAGKTAGATLVGQERLRPHGL
jgi:hypothetical protein